MIKDINVMSVLFGLMFLVLSVTIFSTFEAIDLAYLVFTIGCFIRYLYIKKH